MGQELSKAVYQPPPLSYDETLKGFHWANHQPSSGGRSSTLLSPGSSSSSSSSSAKQVPAVFLEWRGDEGQSASFTLLYAKDNMGDLGHLLPWLELLRDTLHVNVAGFDYSGYGLNKAAPSEAACYEDIHAVYSWLIESKNISSDKIIIMGKALGTGPAIDLAHSIYPGRDKQRRGSRISHFGRKLIREVKNTPQKSHSLSNPFNSSSKIPAEESSGDSGSDSATSSTVSFSVTTASSSATSVFSSSSSFSSSSLGESEEERGLAALILQSPITSVLDMDGSKFHMGMADIFETTKKAERIRCPTLLMHAADDVPIPKSHSKKLAKKLPNVWKVVELEGTTHATLEDSHDFLDTLVLFLDALSPSSSASFRTPFIAPEQYHSPTQVVFDWLAPLCLESYTELFIQSGYFDMTAIQTLDELDLMAMGIEDEDHKRTLYEAILSLKNNTGDAQKPALKRSLSWHSNEQSSLSPKSGSDGKKTGSDRSGDKKDPSATETMAASSTSTPSSRNSGKSALFTDVPRRRGSSTRSRVPFSQIQKRLAQYETSWKDIELGESLKKGFFEEVRLCTWKGKKMVCRHMPSKQHQQELFSRQCCTLCELNHPNLLLPVAVCTESPNLSIITEYLEGGSLQDFLQRTRKKLSPSSSSSSPSFSSAAFAAFPNKLRLEIALQIAEALKYLHSQDPCIVHRDLTSRNVLLNPAPRLSFSSNKEHGAGSEQHKGEENSSSSSNNEKSNSNAKHKSLSPRYKKWEGRVRVADFGLSRPPSFLWMAPEIFVDKKYLPVSDVFSYGVILWELLTLDEPYKGMQPAVAAMRVAKRNFRLPLPDEEQSNGGAEALSPEVTLWCDLIRSCWQQLPENRPTAEYIVDLLKAMLPDENSSSSSSSSSTSIDSTSEQKTRTKRSNSAGSSSDGSAPSELNSNESTSSSSGTTTKAKTRVNKRKGGSAKGKSKAKENCSGNSLESSPEENEQNKTSTASESSSSASSSTSSSPSSSSYSASSLLPPSALVEHSAELDTPSRDKRRVEMVTVAIEDMEEMLKEMQDVLVQVRTIRQGVELLEKRQSSSDLTAELGQTNGHSVSASLSNGSSSG